MVSKKEQREIAFMLGAVLLVAVVGFGLQAMVPGNSAVAGAAVSLDSETPTYNGILYLLEDACHQVAADGISTCDDLCGSSTCIPLEDNCDVATDYQCHCCDDLSS